MVDVFIANTAAEVDNEFLTRRDQPQTWTQPQTFPSGTALAPSVVVGVSGNGLFENNGELHYGTAGNDRGELIGKNEVSAPGTILGQLVYWNQNILRWQFTPNRLVSDDGSQLQPVAGITGPVEFDDAITGATSFVTAGDVTASSFIGAALVIDGKSAVGSAVLDLRVGGFVPAQFTTSSYWANGLRGMLLGTDAAAAFDVSAAAPFFRAGASAATDGEVRLSGVGRLVGTNVAADANIDVVGVDADLVFAGDAARGFQARGNAHGFFGTAPVGQPAGVTAAAALEALGLATGVVLPVINFTDLAGVIADGQVPASAVTQHQAALAIDWAQLFGTQPPPIAHDQPFTSITGTNADAQVIVSNVAQHEASLSIGWGQLTGVPATFPPDIHGSSHSTGGADLVTLDRIVDSGGDWRLDVNGQGMTLTVTGANDQRRFTGCGRIYLETHEGGLSGTFQSRGGSWPSGQNGYLRGFASSGGNGFRVTFSNGVGGSVQVNSFADEEEGVAETPTDYVETELFNLQDRQAQILQALADASIPLPGLLTPNPYAVHAARPRTIPKQPGLTP